jgi:hypothetical protein
LVTLVSHSVTMVALVRSGMGSNSKLSRSQLRRSVPFRRSAENATNTSFFRKGADETWRFLQLTGASDVLTGEGGGLVHNCAALLMLVTSTSGYRVPNSILRMLRERDKQPYFQVFNHGGYELYAARAAYLISAGGVFRPGWDADSVSHFSIDAATTALAEPARERGELSCHLAATASVRADLLVAGSRVDAAKRLVIRGAMSARWVAHVLGWSLLFSCALDERQVSTEAQPAVGGPRMLGSAGSSCSAGASGCSAAAPSPLASTPVSCAADGECPASAPTCVNSLCSCTLALAQLSSDPKNCGSCGNECSAMVANASCQQGRCVPPGEPGPSEIARSAAGTRAVLSAGAHDGLVMRSSKHSLQLSTGQAPGGNEIMKSNSHALQSGLLGASALPPQN